MEAEASNWAERRPLRADGAGACRCGRCARRRFRRGLRGDLRHLVTAKLIGGVRSTPWRPFGCCHTISSANTGTTVSAPVPRIAPSPLSGQTAGARSSTTSPGSSSRMLP